MGALCYCVASFLVLLYALRRPGVGSYAFYCLSVVLACLMGLDVGVACIAAGVVTYLVVWVRSRERVRLGRLLVVSAVSILLCVALWAALCVLCGVDPIERLREFVSAAASNANWATTPVGDAEDFLTLLCYFVMPLCLLALLVRFVLFEELPAGAITVRTAAWVAVVFFSTTTLANLSRRIVRHNLAEGSGVSLFGTVGMAVLAAVFYFCRKCGVDRTRTFGRFVMASALVCAAYGLAAQDGVSVLGGSLSEVERAVSTWSSAENYKEAPVGGNARDGLGLG